MWKHILCTDCRKLINKEIGYDTLKQNANVPKAYYIYSWRNYDENFFKKIVEATNRFKNNLHLVGGSFTGKTVLMIACIDYLIKYGENSILFYNVPELLTNAQKEGFSYYNYLINKWTIELVEENIDSWKSKRILKNFPAWK